MKKNLFNKIENIIQEKINIPNLLYKEIKRFFIAFFCAWILTIIINDFIFAHFQFNNSLVVNSFTRLLVFLTEFLLKILNFETYHNFKFLKIMGTSGVRFEIGCLGLRPMTLFSFFIIFQYGKWFNKLWFQVVGISILIFTNAIRSTIICASQINFSENTTLIHDITSPAFMYPTILLLWLIWISSFGKLKKT